MSGSNSDTPYKNSGLTYKDAGVDIEAGAQLIERIAPAAKASFVVEVVAAWFVEILKSKDTHWNAEAETYWRGLENVARCHRWWVYRIAPPHKQVQLSPRPCCLRAGNLGQI